MRPVLFLLLTGSLTGWSATISYSIDCGGVGESASDITRHAIDASCATNGVLAYIAANPYYGDVGAGPTDPVHGSASAFVSMTAIYQGSVFYGPATGYWMRQITGSTGGSAPLSMSAGSGPWTLGEPGSLANAIPYVAGVDIIWQQTLTLSVSDAASARVDFVDLFWDSSGNPVTGPSIHFIDITEIPEPGTGALLGTGVLATGIFWRRMKQ